MTQTQDTELREADIALVDVIKTLMDMMMTAGVATPTALDGVLGQLRDGYMLNQMATAAGIMEHLRRFATDPARGPNREAIRKALEQPPQGSA